MVSAGRRGIADTRKKWQAAGRDANAFRAHRLPRTGELLARQHRAGRERAHLLITHVAGRPAEAAVGIDVELLGGADREPPPDARRHVLRAFGIEALHVDDPGPELAILAVLLPEVELRELPARELEHELLRPGLQHAREVRPVGAVEPRPPEAVAEADVEAELGLHALGGQVEEARHLL